MPEVQLIARHTMKPGTESEVLPLVEQLIDAARTEPGNLAFDAYRSLREPESYVLLERYESRDALAAHRATPHFQQIVIEKLVPLLAARTIDEFDVPDHHPTPAAVIERPEQIHGYDYGTDRAARSPLSLEDLERLKAVVWLTDED